MTLLFFDFGSGEILLIVLVAFLIFGPDKIPEMARNIGKFINEVKRASEDIKTEINREADKREREKKLADYKAKLDLQPKDVSTTDSSIVNENSNDTEEVSK